MADLAGQPVRGSSLTLGGLPALEYDFSYFASAVPSLRSHAFVLIDGATGYIVNCESTDAHREEMDRAIEVVLRSPRPR